MIGFPVSKIAVDETHHRGKSRRFIVASRRRHTSLSHASFIGHEGAQKTFAALEADHKFQPFHSPSPMITVMRKHHKVLMIIITALVCISFSWYWNKTDFAQMGREQVGKIYDRNVSRVEFQRNARLLRLSGELGMTALIQGLTAGARTEAEAFENFTRNLLVLRHEANRLGVRTTAPEIAEVVKTLPAFRGENGFDLNKYTNFTDHELAPMGFSEAEIEELAADQLSMERLEQLLGVGVQVSDAETESNYEQAYGKMNVSVIRFRSDEFAKEVKISEDDVAKYYETHKAQLKSEEKRNIT